MTYVEFDDDMLDAQHAERKWLAKCRETLAARSDHMRQAAQLGISVTEIAALVGLSRQHVSEIVHGRRP